MISHDYAGRQQVGRSFLRRLISSRLLLRIKRFRAIGLRRAGWFTHQLTARRAFNLLFAAVEYLLRRKAVLSLPAAVKIDISPLCNLHCTVCVHAHSNGNPALEKQRFRASQKMELDQFRRIVERIRKTTSAVSLYYLGDPLMHPDIERMCEILSAARLNSHINTNFSFQLSEQRLERLVASGLTHLTVCLDGLSQETYSKTRVGGRVDRVLANLRRVCEIRKRRGLKYPLIEIQFIKFQHNVHELEEARALCERMGVDTFVSFWGSLDNYTDSDPTPRETYDAREYGFLPGCAWPYFSTVVKYNGDVIPCCNYRLGMQYTEEDDCRILGNVFETSLKEIWRSAPYQAIRRLVCNPGLANDQLAYRELFCHGCWRIYAAKGKPPMLRGNERSFESVYTMNEQGIPVRRSTTRAPRLRRPEATLPVKISG